jgi:hypothetical protein
MMRKKNKIYDTVITVIIGQSKTPIYEKVTKNYNLKISCQENLKQKRSFF